MKRIILVLAAATLLFGLCACGPRPGAEAPQITSTPAATDAPAPEIALPEPPAGMWRLASFTEDLDGDGTREHVLIDSDDEQLCVVTVVSGERILRHEADYPYAPSLYTLHALWGDQTRQIVLSGDTGSVDYVTELICYADGALTHTEIDGYPAELHNDGTIVMSVPVDILGTYGGLCVYTIGRDLSAVCDEEYRIETYEGFAEARTLTVQRDGLAGRNAAGETVALPKGTTLLLQSTNLKDTVCCASSLGYDVYLAVTRPPDEWEWHIGGLPESEWFGELMYAG